MSAAGTNQSQNLAGSKRRSLSGQGGLLNRMFGSSGGNGKDTNSSAVAVDGPSNEALPSSPTTTSNPMGAVEETKEASPAEVTSPTKSSANESAQNMEKKRRSSGVGRARDLFSSAKQSLRDLSSSSPDNRAAGGAPQTPMQKLGKMDPALGVPQGAHNNSAGESAPGPRSTFRVGVTEDKNKKCRRTMEDTHAFLYNFLSTPAPTLNSDASSKARSSLEAGSALSETSSQGVVETDNGYFAVFDGHAGTFAADWCGKKVHILLEEVIRKHPNSPIPELLDMTFTSVDQQLEKLPLKNSGCTAIVAVLRWEDRIPNSQSATGSTAIAPATAAAVKSESGEVQSSTDPANADATEVKLRQAATRQRVLYTANVGDARIVLCRNGKALRLSYDHKGSDENEGKRIAGAGGLILNNRVNGVLAVTRALGDAYMKDLVTGHPYTTETVIQPDIDEFMILACDGLWDVCSDQEAVDLIRNTQDPQTASRQLVEHALARFSTDNLSCMVVRFDSKAVQQTVAQEVEPIGVDGDPATKKGGVSEAEAIVMEQKAKLEQTGEKLDRIPSDLEETVEEHKAAQEPGPELNPEAVEMARKDREGSAPN
ncbi:mgpp2cl-1, protein phosphatase 2C-like protein 1 [Elasticomyces elasticus]|nr:mgpp2cl-1, protein phosphatase 2C-like protein 1 [Elasticomyces elasticus]KAK3667628.1 mgpp2cl-1, protein phosphatase 2C-like protein 1 [Elasticomyces elasticus]KAK4928416.1 mgpp2cl-1, protein phosphatase 2C-like protein 1 [Elasticomyces elasticus]KAK5767217.1 mgpp2cl-1, protein phosphatase 2C-like protein 1 [Elasticomyces elasticus]